MASERGAVTGAAARKPPRRLRIVENDMPVSELAASLNGDLVHDDKLIDQFCQNYRVTRKTLASRLKPYGHSIRDHW